MKRLALAVACCLVTPAFAEVSFDLLPHGRPFRLTFADPREIGMALHIGAASRLNAAIGNYFSLVGLSDGEPGGASAHFGLEGAGFFTMRAEGARFPLETTDGLIGAYLEGKQGPWQAQLRYTHISAHRADGLPGVYPPPPYSRETLSLRGAYAPSPEWSVYVGASYLTNTIPVLPPLGVQAGGMWFIPVGLHPLTPFLAVDIQARQEWVHGPSISAELGLALNNPTEAYRSFRFFYAYYNGSDPRGQFRLFPVTSHSLGIEMQI